MNVSRNFAHGYGYEVSWEIVEEPLRMLPDTVALLTSTWRRWLGVGLGGS